MSETAGIDTDVTPGRPIGWWPMSRDDRDGHPARPARDQRRGRRSGVAPRAAGPPPAAPAHACRWSRRCSTSSSSSTVIAPSAMTRPWSVVRLCWTGGRSWSSATRRARDTESNIFRNFGSPMPGGLPQGATADAPGRPDRRAGHHLPRHRRGISRAGRRGARPGGGDCQLDPAHDRAAGADRGRHRRRGRIRRGAGHRGGGRGPRPGERGLLGHLARGLRGHPVALGRRRTARPRPR